MASCLEVWAEARGSWRGNVFVERLWRAVACNSGVDEKSQILAIRNVTLCEGTWHHLGAAYTCAERITSKRWVRTREPAPKPAQAGARSAARETVVLTQPVVHRPNLGVASVPDIAERWLDCG